MDLTRFAMLDRKGRPDLIGHILLCAGWSRDDIGGDQIAPEWLWDAATGAPTKLAIRRLGLAKAGVLVIEELLRLADIGTYDEMRQVLLRLASMPRNAEFRVRIVSDKKRRE